MIGKLQATAAPLCTLSGIDVLEIAGRDAAAFLQAQTMNDVAALSEDEWQWNGCLSAKGRVLALFALLRVGPEQYWAVLQDVAAAELAQDLRRYVFRARLALTPLEDLRVSGSLGEAARSLAVQGSGARLGRSGATLAIDVGGAVSRQLLLERGPAADQATAPPASSADGDDAMQALWRCCDLAFGLPRLEPSQRDAFTPQMLSLERLRAFSLTKGCYPGQEIVARTHYLGQAKRRLLLVEAADGGGVSIGEQLSAGESSIGQVVSVAAWDGTTLALTVAAAVPGSSLTEGSGLRVGQRQAQLQPFLDGLAR